VVFLFGFEHKHFTTREALLVLRSISYQYLFADFEPRNLSFKVGQSVLKQKFKVVYWNNIPSPYMVERFNALADHGVLDFEAWFNDRTEADRSWLVDESSWRFKYRYMPVTRIRKRRLHWPWPLLRTKPDVLVSLYAEPVFLFGWFLARLQGTKTAFWCQVTMDRWIKRAGWKNAIKRFVFQKVDATLGSGEESRAFAIRYGIPSEKAMRLPHSIDVIHYAKGSAQSRLKRDSLRSDMGLEGVVFIYVGRFWWGKGITYLLDAFEQVQNENEFAMSLLFVGDGPEEGGLKQQCINRGIKNVVFAGFKQKPDLPVFYALSDVFVFPTLGDPYGLVLDEAMACSLPVISTSAAGEIRDRVEGGINGYIVPPENSAALAERMLELACNAGLREKMGERSYEKIKDHTPDKWALDFERIIESLLARNA
jgi:glycosyltransferase involved in cell wall biosynthesis